MGEEGGREGGRRGEERLLGKAARGESDNWGALHVYVTAGGLRDQNWTSPTLNLSRYKSHNPSEASLFYAHAINMLPRLLLTLHIDKLREER